MLTDKRSNGRSLPACNVHSPKAQEVIRDYLDGYTLEYIETMHNVAQSLVYRWVHQAAAVEQFKASQVVSNTYKEVEATDPTPGLIEENAALRAHIISMIVGNSRVSMH